MNYGLSIGLPDNIHAITGPPPLPYSLHGRKKSIAIWWTLLTTDSCVLQNGLFYGLWYGTRLNHNICELRDPVNIFLTTLPMPSSVHHFDFCLWRYLYPRIPHSSAPSTTERPLLPTNRHEARLGKSHSVLILSSLRIPC